MPKAMIVDDAQFMRMRLAKFLNEQGYEVVEAEDGDVAIQVYRENSPDVVFMDITMPHKDGIQAVVEIRALDPKAKIIMLTALDQQSMLMRAFQAGAREFILKPFRPESVIKALDKVLG